MQLTLRRLLTANKAVLGRLDGLSVPLFTLEDEWRDNKPGESCIPVGSYQVCPHGWEPNSAFRFKQVWQVLAVPGRDAILFHPGNSHQDTHGCVLVGMGLMVNQMASMVTDSRIAVNLLRKEIGENRFALKIV